MNVMTKRGKGHQRNLHLLLSDLFHHQVLQCLVKVIQFFQKIYPKYLNFSLDIVGAILDGDDYNVVLEELPVINDTILFSVDPEMVIL